MRRPVQLLVGLVLAALLLAFFARGISIGDVWAQIVTADLPLLMLALAASLCTYALRAWRWQFLLRPVGPTHFANALRATVIGFAASFVLPGRTGEVLRPFLLARREGLSTMAALATVVLERVLDLIGVLLLFAAVVLFDEPVAQHGAATLSALKVSGLTAGAGSLIAFLFLVLIARDPARARRAMARLAGLLPAAIARIASGIVETFVAGLMILRRPRDAALAFAGSIPLWCGPAITIWAVSRAFHLGIPFSGAFILLILIVIGIAVPTPGGVGTVHYAFRLGATALYAAADDRAVGAAIVFHAITVIPVSVIGVLLAASEGLTLRGLSRMASGPGAPHPPVPAGLEATRNA